MGTGSVESLVLKWFGRMPTVPVPFFGMAGQHGGRPDKNNCKRPLAR